jgi:hypothetical protein
VDEAHTPGYDDENNTYMVAHDCHVVEGLAYCNIAVIGHGHKKYHFTASKEVNKKNLSKTGIKRNSLLVNQ